MRNIAISDIHGCARTFRYLVEEVLQVRPSDTLYLLGDYVDRGPDSKGVLDYMMQLMEGGYQVECLKGNHEDMMVSASRNREDEDLWLNNGGKEAIASFNVDSPADVPQKYIDFVDGMSTYMEVDNYLLVHAGFNFTGRNMDNERKDGFLWKLHNPLRDTESMMWIRWWYDDINWNWLRNRVIIHGHTPIRDDEITEMLQALGADQVLDIDNGCFAKFRDGMGQLCAFDMSNQKLYFQENID